MDADGGIGLVGVAGSSDRCLNLNSGKEKRDRRAATFASISPKVIVRVIVEQRCIRHNVEYLL